MSKLIDDLRGGRNVAARGHLNLDREKARDKLRKFRLPNPHFYVLQLVRAASLLGASRIEFTNRLRRDGVHVRCFSVRRDAARYLGESRSTNARVLRIGRRTPLALGLGSAQALNPARIDVMSSRCSAHAAGRLGPGSPISSTTTAPSST